MLCRSTHELCHIDGMLYSVGGNDGSSSLNSIEVCPRLCLDIMSILDKRLSKLDWIQSNLRQKILKIENFFNAQNSSYIYY